MSPRLLATRMRPEWWTRGGVSTTTPSSSTWRLTADGREAAPRKGLSRGAVRLLAILGVLLMALGVDGLVARHAGARAPTASPTSSPRRRSANRSATTSPTRRRCGSPAPRTSCPRARPIVTDALAAAIATAAGRGGDPRLRRARPRADLPAPAAPPGRTSTPQRPRSPSAARSQTINPALANKLPAERARRDDHHLAVEHRRPAVPRQRVGRHLYIPCSSLGLALLGLAVVQAPRPGPCAPRRRRRGAPWPGALLVGHRRARRRVRRVAATNDPGRGDAVARSSRCCSDGSSAPGGRSSSSASPSRSLPGTTAATCSTAWRGSGRGWPGSARSPRWRFAGGVGARGPRRARADAARSSSPDRSS